MCLTDDLYWIFFLVPLNFFLPLKTQVDLISFSILNSNKFFDELQSLNFKRFEPQKAPFSRLFNTQPATRQFLFLLPFFNAASLLASLVADVGLHYATCMPGFLLESSWWIDEWIAKHRSNLELLTWNKKYGTFHLSLNPGFHFFFRFEMICIQYIEYNMIV